MVGGRAADPGPKFRLITGGQSGVDRAALDAALEAGIPCGGWCPAGRWAEDGPIDAHYPLTETPQTDPAVRTRWNVRETDATLVLTLGAEDEGTRLALDEAEALGRPRLAFDLSATPDGPAARRIGDWIAEEKVRSLNVAGPRESNAPGIYVRSRAVIAAVLSGLRR